MTRVSSMWRTISEDGIKFCVVECWLLSTDKLLTLDTDNKLLLLLKILTLLPKTLFFPVVVVVVAIVVTGDSIVGYDDENRDDENSLSVWWPVIATKSSSGNELLPVTREEPDVSRLATLAVTNFKILQIHTFFLTPKTFLIHLYFSEHHLQPLCVHQESLRLY